MFTYNGLGGKDPGSVTFDMNMLQNIGALLDLSLLNDTSFQVDLVDQTNGTAISVIPTQKLSANASWTAVPSASVNPKLLKIGRPYKIKITTSYHAVVTVVATGVVGYDNVRLTTAASTTATAAVATVAPRSPTSSSCGSWSSTTSFRPRCRSRAAS